MISTFKNLNDLEENLSVKKIQGEAKIFIQDESKALKERLKVFAKYGEKKSYIHRPLHPGLHKIFHIALEYDAGMYVERHETVDCFDVIDWWIQELSEDRCEISYLRNEYHPELLKETRNYIPSKEAIKKLQTYYEGILLKEGIVSFEFDW